MNYLINTTYKKAAHHIIVVSGLLFSIFSFVYLYCFQCDVVQALHYSLSQGKTYYSYLIGAIIVTIILVILARLVQRSTKIDPLYLSWSFFPSFVCLSLLTDIDYSVYLNDGSSLKWIWVLLALVVVFFGMNHLFRLLSKLIPEEKKTASVLYISNLIILLVLAGIPITISNTNINFHHELAVEKAIHDTDYKRALKVGYKSLETSRTLTALRAYAMSLSGENGIGEYLFSYPQPYASDGLLFPPQSKHVLRINTDSIYNYLGEKQLPNESVSQYLARLYNTQSGTFKVLDYYLASLLLDKKLDLFSKTVNDCFFKEDTLPRYYKEALILHHQLSGSNQTVVNDSLMNRRFNEFAKEQQKYGAWIIEKNKIRREFGDTYWWYYYYQ